MKTYRIIKSATRIAAIIALASLVPLTANTFAAGGPKPRPPHVELKISGPIFTLPDHTGREYVDLSVWDQCRESGLDATSLGQRLTTMNVAALGLGSDPIRKAIRLEFAAKSAGVGSPVVFSFWPTKNCQLLVGGFIVSGVWPLPAGSPGTELVVMIPAGATWAFNPYGGAPAYCNGGLIVDSDQPVSITIRRNEARTGNVCDCPFDYTNTQAAACP